MPSPYFIGIAGMMGSGKSTLARGLGQRLGWRILPRRPGGRDYLRDLFTDSRRWAFEAQVSFLVQRAREIAEAQDQNADAVLDRTVYEDVRIFATHFHQFGQIDDRSYKTYQTLSEYYMATLPTPDIVIYCHCPISIVQQRLIDREREADRSYPPGHMESIAKLYAEWAPAFDDAPLYRLDTENNDVREGRVIERIIDDIRALLLEQGVADRQLQLFGAQPRVPSRQPMPELLHQLDSAAKPDPVPRQRPIAVRHDAKSPSFPVAYIAAPFTAVATEAAPVGAGTLFDISGPHGQIPHGPYRNMLLGVVRSLRQYGINPILPHRDYNKWGRQLRQPEEVVALCTDGVMRADLFIGILGSSLGSHYEYGIACGLGIPRIVVRCAEIDSSFFARGVDMVPGRVLVLSCVRIAEVPRILRSSVARDFLDRNLLVH